MDAGGAFAPNRERIRRIAGLHVEFDIVLACESLDQFCGARRASLFTIVQQESNGREVFEAQVMQNLERGKRVDHACLFIAHTGTMGAIFVNAEGPDGRGAGAKHRVDMRNDEDPSPAFSVEHGDQIVGKARGFGRLRPDRGAQLSQARGEH